MEDWRMKMANNQLLLVVSVIAIWIFFAFALLAANIWCGVVDIGLIVCVGFCPKEPVPCVSWKKQRQLEQRIRNGESFESGLIAE
jgi:hypothetical protein